SVFRLHSQLGYGRKRSAEPTDEEADDRCDGSERNGAERFGVEPSASSARSWHLWRSSCQDGCCQCRRWLERLCMAMGCCVDDRRTVNIRLEFLACRQCSKEYAEHSCRELTAEEKIHHVALRKRLHRQHSGRSTSRSSNYA